MNNATELIALAYPVTNGVYMVKAGKKKEFYQNVYDAFDSKLYQDNAGSEIIEVPVVPTSKEAAKSERLSLEINGKARDTDFLVDRKMEDHPQVCLKVLNKTLLFLSILGFAELLYRSLSGLFK